MLNRRVIATLIAGTFAAAQAGATGYLSGATGSISDRGYQAQSSEVTLSEDSFPRHVTVFHPDGFSYSIVADAYEVSLEPHVLLMTAESMPEHLTVFAPDGTVTAYSFTPVDITAYYEPEYGLIAFGADEALSPELLALNETPLILIEVAEPIIVGMTDAAYSQAMWSDTEGAPWSTPDHVAAFDDALRHTG